MMLSSHANHIISMTYHLGSFLHGFLVPFLYSPFLFHYLALGSVHCMAKKLLVLSLQVIYCIVIMAHNGTSEVLINKNQKPAILNSDHLTVLKRGKKSIESYKSGINVQGKPGVYTDIIGNSNLQLTTGTCTNRKIWKLCHFNFVK